jgi:hypothetical protein
MLHFTKSIKLKNAHFWARNGTLYHNIIAWKRKNPAIAGFKNAVLFEESE